VLVGSRDPGSHRSTVASARDGPCEEHLHRSSAHTWPHFPDPLYAHFFLYAPSPSYCHLPPIRDEVTRGYANSPRGHCRRCHPLLENEKDVYGDTIERARDLLESIDHPHPCDHRPSELRAMWATPYPMPMRPTPLASLHARQRRPIGRHDSRTGEGAGCWPELLARLRADATTLLLD